MSPSLDATNSAEKTVVTVPVAQQPVVTTGRRSVILHVLGSSNMVQSTLSSLEVRVDQRTHSS